MNELELANAAAREGRFADAEALYARAQSRIGLQRGLCLERAGRRADAVEALRLLRQCDPDDQAAAANECYALAQSGRTEECLSAGLHALARFPDNLTIRQNHLLYAHYRPHDPEAIRAAHADAGDRLMDVVPLPDGRIRVGFVSPDFREHACMRFFLPLLRHLDRSRFAVYCYSLVRQDDEYAREVERLADHYRDLSQVDDYVAVGVMRADGLAAAVDLAGHTGNNRLGIFARRAAPVQISWLGYPGTTGLETMDLRLTDAASDPAGNEAHYTETLHRLPVFLSFEAVPDAPEVAPSPAARTRAVTFGSFCSAAKLSEAVLSVWAAILTRCGGKLVLKNHALEDEDGQNRVLEFFAGRGIIRSRLILLGHTPTYRAHLEAYARVDIALDAFPYNGTTTTCEALYMGVPVVTLPGRMHHERVGASLLAAAGKREWIAGDAAEYVGIAAGLAQDIPRLRRIRRALRGELRMSELMNHAGFARQFERALLKYIPSAAPSARN